MAVVNDDIKQNLNGDEKIKAEIESKMEMKNVGDDDDDDDDVVVLQMLQCLPNYSTVTLTGFASEVRKCEK